MTVSTEFVCPVQTNPMIKCSYDNDEGSICVRKDCKNSSVSSCNCVNGLCSWSVGEPSKRKKWKNKFNFFKFSLSDVGKRLFGWRLWKLRKRRMAIGWKLCLVRNLIRLKAPLKFLARIWITLEASVTAPTAVATSQPASRQFQNASAPEISASGLKNLLAKSFLLCETFF